MKRIFRVIRYSSVGVFLAGIFTTIVGCSTEDQIRALILFLLLLLTGGGGSGTEEAAPSPTGTLPIIDLFTAPESFSVPCVDDVTSRSITATESAAYNIRQINSNGFFGDSNQMDVAVGGGTMSFSLALNPNGNFCQVLFDYPLRGEEGPAFDASSFARLQFDVVSHTQLNGNVICQASVDLTKSGVAYFGGTQIDTNGEHLISFPLYPFPADTTSIHFACQLDPGEAVEVRNLKLVGTLIDDQNINQNRTNQSCQSGNTRDATITNYFEDIDSRTLTAGSPTATGTSLVNFQMFNGFSTILFSIESGTGCDYPNDVTQGAMATWYDADNDDNTDFSQADSVRITYPAKSGTITGCFMAVQDSAGNVIESAGPFTLNAVPIGSFGEIILPLSGNPALASANAFTLYGCDFGGNSTVTFNPPHVIP